MGGVLVPVVVVTILIFVSKATIGQRDSRDCSVESDCGQNEVCLCDQVTCNSSSCACPSGFYRNSSEYGHCKPKKLYNETCLSSFECTTWFSVCLDDVTDDDREAMRCLCPEPYVYDSKTDECTNAPPCPLDKSFIYNKDAHTCHKLITYCDKCSDINEACSLESQGRAIAIGQESVMLADRIWNTMWKYGIYQPSPCTYTVFTPDVLIATESSGGWAWLTDQIDIPDVLPDSTHSCLYMVWNNGTMRMTANDNCLSEPAIAGCHIKLPERICLTDTDTSGTIWNATEAGTTVTLDCPVKHEGIISRECTQDGHYGQPIYNCSLKTLKILKKKLDNMTVDVTTALNDLYNETAPLTGLYPDDVVIVHDILDDIVERSTNVTLTETSIDEFFNVTNLLLANDRQNSQQPSEDITNVGVERFLQRTDSFVETLVQQNTTLRLNYSNIELEVQTLSQDSDDIRFPLDSHVTSSLFLAKEAFTGKDLKVNASSSLRYKKIPSSLSSKYQEGDANVMVQSTINSDVLSLKLYPMSPNTLVPPLNLYLFPIKETPIEYSHRCAHWENSIGDGQGTWSSDGCREVIVNITTVHCQCDHLTNFAILLSPKQTAVKHESALRIVSLVGCLISVLFLLITVIMYIRYWRQLKSDNSILTLLLCISLLVAYIVFMVGVDRTSIKNLCTAIAAILHYVYLVVFFSMLSKAIHMVILVMFVHNKRSYARHFIIGSLGVPAVIVGISLFGSGMKHYGSRKYCWLVPGSGVFWGFAGIVLAIILMNIIVTGIIVHKLCSTTSMKTSTVEKKVKLTMWSLCILLPVMGITWLFGIFSVSDDTVFWQYIFVVLNSLQGFAIFVFHCVFNKQLKAAMKASRERKRTLEDINSDLKNKGKKTTEQGSYGMTMTVSESATSKVVSDTNSSVMSSLRKRQQHQRTNSNKYESIYNRMTHGLREFRLRFKFSRKSSVGVAQGHTNTNLTECSINESGVEREHYGAVVAYNPIFTHHQEFEESMSVGIERSTLKDSTKDNSSYTDTVDSVEDFVITSAGNVDNNSSMHSVFIETKEYSVEHVESFSDVNYNDSTHSIGIISDMVSDNNTNLTECSMSESGAEREKYGAVEAYNPIFTQHQEFEESLSIGIAMSSLKDIANDNSSFIDTVNSGEDFVITSARNVYNNSSNSSNA